MREADVLDHRVPVALFLGLIRLTRRRVSDESVHRAQREDVEVLNRQLVRFAHVRATVDEGTVPDVRT